MPEIDDSKFRGRTPLEDRLAMRRGHYEVRLTSFAACWNQPVSYNFGPVKHVSTDSMGSVRNPDDIDKLLLYLRLLTARERGRMGHFGTKSMEILMQPY